jgi:DAK2 domain fusion protein YloV
MQLREEWVSGEDFRRMIIGSYRTFMREHEFINNLNVFPVPDGDTGTNMLLTLGAVVRAVSEGSGEGIGVLSKRAANSAIMGARGNSGVILSQIFRGIARGLAGKEYASSPEISKAFQYGVLYAYRSVSKPVEGTILTVAKGIAKGAHRAVREGVPFVDMLSQAIAAGEEELKKTPEMLPVLKTAGVVDAGGKGLIVFLSGCLEGLAGEGSGPEADFERGLKPLAIDEGKRADLTHPYCTEFLVKRSSVGVNEARRFLLPMGDSLVIAEGSNLLKVHIHTAHPGAVLEAAVTWGTLHDIKIDNMADQHRQMEQGEPAGKKGIAVISVAAGEGLAGMMRQLGADIIILGGQTMNPPVEDFVNAVHRGGAEKYIILPNNKNILLAAAQVKKLLGESVELIPTANAPQGMAALMAFDKDCSLEENTARMRARLDGIQAGAVTMAVRDSVADGKTVPAGRFIGVIDTRVVVDAGTLQDALVNMIQKLIQPDNEVVSLYYGAELTPAEGEALAAAVREAFSGLEVELYAGGQPHYHFIISIE